MKEISWEKTGDILFYSGLILLSAFLPESKFVISVAQFVIAAGWLISGNILAKFKSFSQNKLALVITSIFLLHVVGLIYTDDYNYAFKDLRVKLPLLIFPLLIATGPTISKKSFEKLIFLFCGSVLFATIYCTAVWKGWTYHRVYDIRDVSVYISHIRFGLMIAFSTLLLGNFIRQYFNTVPLFVTIALILVIVWFLTFLIILEAITGLIILAITAFLLLCYSIWKQKNTFLRIGLGILLIGVPAYFVYFIQETYRPIKEFNKSETMNIETLTSRGNVYENDTVKKERENGHLIYLYLNWFELKDAWQKRSNIAFDSVGKSGKIIRYTLVRFLSSKGSRKDADAVMAMPIEDIHAVERGVTNINYPKANSLKTRIYEILWEYDNYINGGNPNGHSVVQRLEYWKASLALIKLHPFVGVGTGDINNAFETEYIREHSRLDKAHRLKAHNQFLSITVTFGVIGLLIFLFALIYPVFVQNNARDFYFIVFLLFILMSMCSEDTIETQIGVTFFIFFFSIILFREKTAQIA